MEDPRIISALFIFLKMAYYNVLINNKKGGEYMARKYNLGSKSDMRRFERELKKSVMDQAKTSIMRGTHKVTCPHCGHNLNAHIGSNTCPHCKQLIHLNLDI